MRPITYAVRHLNRRSVARLSHPTNLFSTCPPQAARQLLTLDTKDPKRLFEGPALLRRMARFGLLGEDERELDFVLQLTTEKMLERRLQTKVCGAACFCGCLVCGARVCVRLLLVVFRVLCVERDCACGLL